MNGPSRREDARNVTLVVGAGLLGLLLTARLVPGFASGPRPVVRARPIMIHTPSRPNRGSFDGRDLVYGRVVTREGTQRTGFIRWDRNEGSWADVLDATKGDRKSGLRFGNIRSIEPRGARAARVILKSGQVVDFNSDLTDLGSDVRGVMVTGPGGASTLMRWSDLRRVDLRAAPPGQRAVDRRLWGTLRTRSGLRFTGWITWDVTDIYASDRLDGREGGRERHIPFGEISSIERRGSNGARVILRDGRAVDLRGREDVSNANNGITVSDPGLGEVKLPWRELESVRFHEPPASPGYAEFDGGRPIQGTVITTAGRRITGRVVWDQDESATWEMLDGSWGGVTFQIEFSRIARITSHGRSVTVGLRDGRTFDLEGSNDVDGDNQGIVVNADGWTARIPWREFRELRMSDDGR